MAVSWIEENGKKILYVDYSVCKSSDEMLACLHEYTDILRGLPNRVNCLENYEGSFTSKEFIDEGKVLGKEIHAKKLDKNALIGIFGIKNVLLKTYITFSGQKNVKSFQTKKDALKWLSE